MNTRISLERGLKIVSGGQTGADRAALDWAIAHQIPHRGWCPKGRLAEDGIIGVQREKVGLSGVKSSRENRITKS